MATVMRKIPKSMERIIVELISMREALTWLKELRNRVIVKSGSLLLIQAIQGENMHRSILNLIAEDCKALMENMVS